MENITPNGGSQSMSWEQTFEFDSYGNRNFVEANTNFTGFEKLCESETALCEELRKVLNPAVNQSDNRLSSSDGYVFDDAGNTTRDPQLRTFTYDATDPSALFTFPASSANYTTAGWDAGCATSGIRSATWSRRTCSASG